MTIPPESFDEQPDFESAAPEAIPEDYSPTAPVIETPVESSPEAPSPVQMQPVEDMTLSDLIGSFFRSPGATWNAFRRVVQTPEKVPTLHPLTPLVPVPVPTTTADARSLEAVVIRSPEDQAVRQRMALRLGLWFVALMIAIYGNSILALGAVANQPNFNLNLGAPFLIAAFLLWIVAEVYGAWPLLRIWNHERKNRTEADVQPIEPAKPKQAASSVGVWAMRLVLGVGGLAFSLITVVGTKDNHFTVIGLIAWILSIFLWVAACAPSGWGWGAVVRSVRSIHIRVNWTFWTMLVIMLVAAYFRLYDLNGTPPEMTSDHVEKILDSQRILDGNPQVFFPNNGGREAIQFYLMAIISHIPGLGMNFFTLKFLTAMEGLITIPVLWWMGREMIGGDDPELGNIVGLVLAALVTVSYWDEMLSRLGLRIVLTTLFTALLVIYFSRALRFNRRGDYIKSGLALGFGLYAYQAVRMLPVVVIAGVVIALIFAFIRRRRENQIGRYIANSTVLVLISLVVFVPLLVFSVQYPNDFWRRTSGRLLGDDVVQTTDAQGNVIERPVTLDERMAAFKQNFPILLDNMRNALLMYNWKGDVAWVTAAPNRPEMDIYSGALLIVGLGAWLVWMVRKRDPAVWLMPPMLVIMLLPSALSIAYPIENPSATRTSGTLPVAYLFAALPLALILLSLKNLMPRRAGVVTAFVLAGAVVLLAFASNWNMYFGEYHDIYLESSPAPYTEAGRVLKGFAESGSDFGNAFMIAYPYWWDHRAVGIEAGLLDWPNGIVQLSDTPGFIYKASLRTDRYQFDPNKDILFFYSIEDTQTNAQLKQWFPTGYSQHMTSYKPGGDYMVYHVPPLGAAAFSDFVTSTGAANQ